MCAGKRCGASNWTRRSEAASLDCNQQARRGGNGGIDRQVRHSRTGRHHQPRALRPAGACICRLRRSEQPQRSRRAGGCSKDASGRNSLPMNRAQRARRAAASGRLSRPTRINRVRQCGQPAGAAIALSLCAGAGEHMSDRARQRPGSATANNAQFQAARSLAPSSGLQSNDWTARRHHARKVHPPPRSRQSATRRVDVQHRGELRRLIRPAGGASPRDDVRRYHPRQRRTTDAFTTRSQPAVAALAQSGSQCRLYGRLSSTSESASRWFGTCGEHAQATGPQTIGDASGCARIRWSNNPVDSTASPRRLEVTNRIRIASGD